MWICHQNEIFLTVESPAVSIASLCKCHYCGIKCKISKCKIFTKSGSLTQWGLHVLEKKQLFSKLEFDLKDIPGIYEVAYSRTAFPAL